MNTSLNWIPPLVPEAMVILTALLVLALDLVVFRRQPLASRIITGAVVACAGCIAAMAWIAGGQDSVSAEMLALTPLTQFLKIVLLLLTVGVAIFTVGARFTKHVGEYFALLLLATSGLMLLVSSENLLVIFLALEMLSVPAYVLAAFNKSSLASAESALKYFLFGSVAAAFTLFGISLLYGITGELQLGLIAQKLSLQSASPLCYLAVVMTLAGFAFKVAAAPFHFWAPDVYQGAPAPVVCFVASGSKVASFFVLARIIVDGFEPLRGSAGWHTFAAGWMPVIAVLAVISMLLGNFAALVQTNIRRLLAYSAISHAGYALLAFFGTTQQMFPALFYYVITYALTALGALAVVGVVEDSSNRATGAPSAGSGDQMSAWAGLSRRAPLLSGCMFVFMLSLAGIPPLAGFFGKFYLFTAATASQANFGMLWLVVVAIAASAVSLYYYLQVLKQIYIAEPPAGSVSFRPSLIGLVPITLLAIIVITFGCAPGWLLGHLSHVINSSAFRL
jgi:NADH-quinone oxidoreductase subunit N